MKAEMTPTVSAPASGAAALTNAAGDSNATANATSTSTSTATQTPTTNTTTSTTQGNAANADGKSTSQTSKYDSDKSDKDPFYGLSFKVGVAENKNANFRATMEDVHTYVANFAERLDWGYFAIFDGHAGKQTARWCGNNLHTLLEKELIKDEQLNKKSTSGSSPDSAPSSSTSDMREHMHNSFVRADELILKEAAGLSGCTAAVAVLRWEVDEEAAAAAAASAPTSGVPGYEKPKEDKENSKAPNFDFIPQKFHKRKLYTSNVGDLRIILYRNGTPYRLSYDHKATDVNEINRIRDTGGLILKNRVNGVLAVTRSLGDSYMKDLVIGKPYTTATEIGDEDEFMILACDGLWDVISDLKACQFVAKIFEQDKNPTLAAKKLCQLAMDSSTTDNVTIMIVLFDQSVFTLGEAIKGMRV